MTTQNEEEKKETKEHTAASKKKKAVLVEEDVFKSLNEGSNKQIKAPEVKKPRAFVAESDLFDFSDIKIVRGSDGDKIPTAMDEKEKPKVIDHSSLTINKVHSKTTSEKK